MIRFLIPLLAVFPVSAPALAEDPFRVLLFSHTTGWRHDSIPDGISAIEKLAEREGILIKASEDPSIFDGNGLADYDVLILLNSTTDAKKPESEWFVGSRRDRLQAFVRCGGGIVAIHGAADSHGNWPWYRRMIGGRFRYHPPGTPKATLTRRDHDHPAATAFPSNFQRVDEWYHFDDLDAMISPLITFDPSSIGEADVNPKPTAWAREFEGGRIFYTAMGHTADSYNEPAFMAHLFRGLRWAAGNVTAKQTSDRKESRKSGCLGMDTNNPKPAPK